MDRTDNPSGLFVAAVAAVAVHFHVNMSLYFQSLFHLLRLTF